MHHDALCDSHLVPWSIDFASSLSFLSDICGRLRTRLITPLSLTLSSLLQSLFSDQIPSLALQELRRFYISAFSPERSALSVVPHALF